MEANYEKYKYPSAFKFYKIMKKINPEIKFEEVDSFIKQQKSYQLHKKPRKQIQGHIVAYAENALWFIDLLDMSNYSRQNKGYKWILLAIDTFTRKAYATALKNKTKFEVKNGFEQMYATLGKQPSVKLVITDSGNEFLNKPVQDLFKELKIKHGTVEIGDHNALGLIDRLSRTIKEMIFKDFTEKNSVKWADNLQDYISAYNDRPHSGILDYSPNEANQHARELIDLNADKSMPVEHNFVIGETVRKKLARPTFTKGYKQIWSKRTYTIKSISGVHAILNNDEKIRLDSLQKVIESDSSESEAEIDKVEKEAKIDKKIKKEGIDQENIIENRLRKK